ncbi:hypothetical protein D3C80_1822050 [compost metagenome]
MVGRLAEKNLATSADDDTAIAFSRLLFLGKSRVGLQFEQNVPNVVVKMGSLVSLLLGDF